jgi:hypothetical protein
MSNVCQDQKSFNQAFENAVDNYGKDKCQSTGCKVTLAIITIVMLIFYIWAVLLALRVKDPEHRVLHIIFALMAGPIYVLAYYGAGLR